MACHGQCQSESPLSGLQCPEPAHGKAALEGMRGSARRNKQRWAEEILQSSERERYINYLAHLLTSTESWFCSTAAFLLGVLGEREDVVQALQTSIPEDNNTNHNNIVGALAKLLTSEDEDVVMNAAGAIVSLMGSSAGRGKLLKDPIMLDQVLTSVSVLLGQGRESTVNSAALTLAQLSQSEVACQALLGQPTAPGTIACLVQNLAHSHTDTAMNAAFAVGRLCGSERGRSLVLAAAEEYQLVHSLQVLMSEVSGPEAGQTACFTLSCLVTEEDGHALVLASPSLPDLLHRLLQHLQAEDQESAWFAAMALRVFVSRPAGVLQVREHRCLEERLQFLSCSPSSGQELREEVDTCLRKLERLSKPSSPTTRLLPSGTYRVSWEKCTPESDLKVTYSLLNYDTVLYRGTQCHVTLPVSILKTDQDLSLRLVLSTNDGDTTCSQPLLLAIASVGGVTKPGPPQDLRVIRCTASQVRLGWAVPAGGLKPKAYHLYRGGVLVGTTIELQAIVGGLCPGSVYQFGVCAMGPGDAVGPCADVEVHTVAAQFQAPSGLTMVVLGRHELQVQWGAPLELLGRFFNYELRLNDRVVYLGTEHIHTARRLSANTAYTCTVTAITSRGRCQSRPVTKRTARDEYPNTRRCLYPPTRQPPQTSAPPPAVPKVQEDTPKITSKVREVREKMKTDHSAHAHLPKVHLSSRRRRWSEPDRERHRFPQERRQPLVCTPSPGSESSKIEVSMGQVSGCDMRTLWKRARERAMVSVRPARTPVRPLLQAQAWTEKNLQVKQQSLSDPRTQPPETSYHRANTAPVQAIPPSHSDQDWTGNYKTRLLTDRTKPSTGPTLKTEVRGIPNQA